MKRGTVVINILTTELLMLLAEEWVRAVRDNLFVNSDIFRSIIKCSDADILHLELLGFWICPPPSSPKSDRD